MFKLVWKIIYCSVAGPITWRQEHRDKTHNGCRSKDTGWVSTIWGMGNGCLTDDGRAGTVSPTALWAPTVTKQCTYLTLPKMHLRLPYNLKANYFIISPFYQRIFSLAPSTMFSLNILQQINSKIKNKCWSICQSHDFFTFSKNLKKSDKLRKKLNPGSKKKTVWPVTDKLILII